MQEEVVMADVNVFPFELINKFHRFKLSALPMPLPESELITLYTIRDANQYDGVENTLISGLAEKLHVSVPTISRFKQAGGEGAGAKKQPDKRSP